MIFVKIEIVRILSGSKKKVKVAEKQIQKELFYFFFPI